MTELDKHQWWTISEVCQYLRCSKNHFHTYYKQCPNFPRARKEGYRSVFYKSDQVRAYTEARIDGGKDGF